MILGKKVGTSPREEAVPDPGLANKFWICIQHVGAFLRPFEEPNNIDLLPVRTSVDAGRSSAISHCILWERMSRTWRKLRGGGGWNTLSSRSLWCASFSNGIVVPMRLDRTTISASLVVVIDVRADGQKVPLPSSEGIARREHHPAGDGRRSHQRPAARVRHRRWRTRGSRTRSQPCGRACEVQRKHR